MVLACVCPSVGPALSMLRVPACGQPIRETAGQYLCCVVSNNFIIDVSLPWKIIVTVNILYPPSVETDRTIVLLSGIQQPWDRCSCARYTFTLTFWWPHSEVYIILFFHFWPVYQRSCWIAVPLYMYDLRQLYKCFSCATYAMFTHWHLEGPTLR